MVPGRGVEPIPLEPSPTHRLSAAPWQHREILWDTLCQARMAAREALLLLRGSLDTWGAEAN